MGARPITFLSDYGYDDEFAGICRAVIAGIAPDARVVDITHGIRRHSVGEGAAVLAKADDIIWAPDGPEWLQPIIQAVPLQLLAYHIALLRGCDVDKPRNLAKSVTVE